MQQINRQSATSRCCRRRRRSDATSRSLSLPPLLTQQINRQSATSRFRRRHTYWELKKWTVDLNQYACESLRLNHPETNEIKPPETLVCCLRPYQKQALYWMSELEKGTEAEQTTKVLHPCWAAYRICDKRGSAIYVNIFSSENKMGNAMGLGKTVMTIALQLQL